MQKNITEPVWFLQQKRFFTEVHGGRYTFYGTAGSFDMAQGQLFRSEFDIGFNPDRDRGFPTFREQTTARC